MSAQSSIAILRAKQLIAFHRYKEAEVELRGAIAQTPDNAEAHFLLAITLGSIGKYNEANTEARTTIRLEPDAPYGHYALAIILRATDKYDRAMLSIREAIRIDPQNPEYYAVLSEIYLGKRQWQAALQAAEEGLKFEPEHIRCVNFRSTALSQLGRNTEAGFLLNTALRSAPQEALTHASQGWLHLKQGLHQKALEDFREALRIDPNFEYARAGIVEALKARNIIYRGMLKYFFLMSRLTTEQQWGIIIVGFIVLNVLRGASRNNPDLNVIVVPIFVVYGAFAFLTWTSSALFNLMLRLNRFGRLSLSKEQIIASNWVGLCLFSGLLLGIVGLFTQGSMRNELLEAALMSIVLIVPVSGVFHAYRKENRNRLTLFAVSLAVLMILKLIFASIGSPSSVLTGLFIFGFIAYVWTANILLSRE